MMEFFLSGILPLIDFVICDVMSDMANKLLSLSLSVKTVSAKPYVSYTKILAKLHFKIGVDQQLGAYRKAGWHID